jgi:hypothetical protein
MGWRRGAHSPASLILAAAPLLPYDGLNLAGLQVFSQEQRIVKLERDLAKLEGIVEQLVSGMSAEHQAMKESRAEDRAALKDLGERMERSVTSLADEMKRLAERNAAVDKEVLVKQSQALGAIAVTRWIIGTALAAAMLVIAYESGRNKVAPSSIQPQSQGRQAP